MRLVRRSGRARASRLAGAALLAVLLTLGLAGCSSDPGYTPAGPFRPLPEGAPPEVGPPQDTQPVPAPSQPGQTEPGSGTQAGDPNVVATGLTVPTGLVVLPDGTAVVGERDSGRLLQVFPDRAPARELMTVPGLDTSGDGGLLGLALSPTFLQDGLLYAYVTTPADNRVVRFPIGGTPNPVLVGLPRAATHNGGGLTFSPDGTLFVGTGDAGTPASAQDPASLAGKVLHVDVFGQPVGPGGPVYARGYSDVTALCVGGDTGSGPALFATDDSAAGDDELDPVAVDADGGWPTKGPGSADPLLQVPGAEGGFAGCTVAGSTVYVGSLDGQRIRLVQLDAGAGAGDPQDLLAGQYGRLRTVVADREGALWVTTSNRDGLGTPVQDDDRVLRIVPPNSSSDSPL